MSTARETLIEQLRPDEGLRLRAYKCTAGKWTIGYGRNLTARGIADAVAASLVCTKEQAEAWLAEDADQALRECRAFAGFDSLNESRKAVIANMVFNMGFHRVGKFVQMWAAIKAGDFVTAADEMRRSWWAKQVGDRAERLAKLMREG